MHVNSVNTAKATARQPDQAVEKNKKAEVRSQEPPQKADKQTAVSKAELKVAMDKANEIGQMLKRKLNFSVDEGTERVVVQVINEETGETVRQIPPKEMLRIAAHLEKLQQMNNDVMDAVKSVILDVRY